MGGGRNLDPQLKGVSGSLSKIDVNETEIRGWLVWKGSSTIGDSSLNPLCNCPWTVLVVSHRGGGRRSGGKMVGEKSLALAGFVT